MKKKILIGSIIAVVLLTLVSFSSVVGKISTDEKLVEFDVELCGLNRKHTVQLTQQEAEELDVSERWKFYPACFIQGYHYGGVWPEFRFGPAVGIIIEDGTHYIDIFGIGGKKTISELIGFGFIGRIGYYSTPRIPGEIFGIISFCFYKE